MTATTRIRLITGFKIPAMAVAGIALLVLSCGDGAVEPPPPPAPVATTVTVNPGSTALSALGETARFTAEVRDQNGQVMTGAAVAWASSDASVAAVDASGVATAAGNGSATITATAGSVSGTAAVTVAQVVTAVAVSPAADTLVAFGDTVRLVAEATDANGHGVAGSEFSWSSSDTLVARVDDSGLVTGVDEGMATITATAGEYSGVAEITTVENTDRAALVALYEATDGPNWIDNTNWLTDAPLGEWYGVKTDASGRVVELDLGGRWDRETRAEARHGLTGPIPPELGNLSNLQTLTLHWNGLSGPVPPELGQLDNLRWLSLSQNRLQGRIPAELGSVGELQYLFLGGNLLTGPIPSELGNLIELRRLQIGHNSLSGPIPPELGGLTDLTRLELPGNTLSGPIPPELGNLLALQILDFNTNRLSGPIPPELGKLSELTWLNLHKNRLTGQIPTELKNLTGLTLFSVDSNQLTGPIPEWLRDLTNLESLALSWNNLTGAIPPWLGTLTNLESLNLARSGLSGPIPPELGGLAKLRRLGLGGNELTGTLPPELADLGNLEELEVGGNLLTGPLPQEFVNLPKLRSFGCLNDHGFCVPGTGPFADWVDGLEAFEGPWCNQSDATVLESLYQATDGPDWRESEGWLEGPALGEWHGVRADTLGRVTAIDLADNDLAGQGAVQSGLSERVDGTADRRQQCVVRSPSRSRSPSFRFPRCTTPARTCVPPADGAFREWLNGVASHEGTGVRCAPISEREILADVYRATGGPGWGDSDMWMTDAPLGEWTGVETDSSGRIVGLDLSRQGLSGPIPAGLGMLANLEQLRLFGNNLSGRIPPELGDLEKLESLDLRWNDLSGSIPPELGTLDNLERLNLSINDLSGPIPPELGDLGNLESLTLFSNNLSGPIPPELGALGNLRWLLLTSNNLSGAIPPDLGTLANLQSLDLRANNLSGPIPAELGALADLWRLDLSENNVSGPIPSELGGLGRLATLGLGVNDLSGSVPPELGTLVNLQELDLTNNTAISGTLPPSFTSLRSLDAILARGTDLCVPLGDGGFRSWLDGISDAQIESCAPSSAYLTQAVQSRTLPVPLVAGEEALLRVFVTSSRASGVGIPPVRARFYRSGTETHAVDIPGTSVPIPATVDEGDLSNSANAVIPAQVVRPGLQIVIEVDPDRTLDPALGLPDRIPQEGRLAVDVREVPQFDLTVIPFLWTSDPDSTVIGMAEGMAANPGGHELLQETHTLLPVAAIEATAHEPVMTSSDSGYDVLRETEMIRVLEGPGHYMGLMADFSDVAGVARLSGRSSASVPAGDVIAHELGHNMSLGHAPCSVPGPDPWYPYPDGSIGAVGYDFPGEYDLVDGGGLVEAWRPDIMSYCSPSNWISDYYFNKALNHRIGSADANMAAIAARPTRTLLLWGGLDADGVPYLDPAFVADALPTLPPAGTEYSIEGADAAGTPLFSYTFDMPVTADAEGEEAGFVFALPVEADWADNLAKITLSGPDRATYSLDEGTNRPMAILRDPGSGQVRGFLRDPPLAGTLVAADAVGGTVGQGMEVLFSRGIPDIGAWRR